MSLLKKSFIPTFIIAAYLFTGSWCFSSIPTTRFPSNRPLPSTKTPLFMATKGTAAKPYDKKKIVVFGAGGYLGSTIYGFLQRAASIYGTGIADISSSPRAICATAVGSGSLNKVLGRSFKLAFAGENFIRLTNMRNVDSIQARIQGYDAAIIGTIYQLETRPVTAGSYEKTPNDKTLEFYLDDSSMATSSVSNDDLEVHLNMFQNTVEACKLAGIQHLVVIETPATTNAKPFAKILDDAGINFTYIRSNGKLENTKLYTFENGIQSDVTIQGFVLPAGYSSKSGYEVENWGNILSRNDATMQENKDCILPREDLAAVVVQSLMSFDWGMSRFLHVSSNGFLGSNDTLGNTRNMKFDKEWCFNSGLIMEKMDMLKL